MILMLILALSTASVGQTLVDFKYSSCDDDNPHKYKMNVAINKIRSSKDSLFIKMTWLANCAFEPEIFLAAVKNDTIYFKYENKAVELVMCGCAFELNFTLQGMAARNYQIKVNDFRIDKNAKRYKTDGYLVEYFPEPLKTKKMREIYFEDGELVAEVYYNKQGDILHEKYYKWGSLWREKKY
ncbi:MAG TPA: hypothetical protein VL443_03295 [Cyclobacteriaceae bacterium]|nr:hypothetical protein [Cyclobacteriaceae bacterium]